MPDFTIEPGKFYKTRDGRKVHIYAVDGSNLFNVHGETMDHTGRWHADIFRGNGGLLLTKECDGDIVGPWVDPPVVDATYPLKAAEMMAEKMVNFHGCPAEIGWGNCIYQTTIIYDECEKDQKYCWLQYFRERAEEGKK